MTTKEPQEHINAALANPREDLEALDQLEQSLFAYRYAEAEISSLGSCFDPKKASATRAEALGIFEQKRVEALRDPAVGALLERLHEHQALLNDQQKAQVKILRRDRAQLVNVPVEEQVAFTKLTCQAQDVWERARDNNDWASFEPFLDKIVEARLRIAQAIDPNKEPYEVMLNEYEEGTSTNLYDPFFAKVRDCVAPLLADCKASKSQPSTAAMQGNFDEKRQWALADDLVELECLDKDALKIAASAHPFTGGPSRDFVLITSHVYTDNLLSHIFSVLHEGGHALYEQHINPAYTLTSLASGTSSGMHESQSRLFENYIGRSEAFAEPLLAVLKKHFPGQFNRATAYQIYQAENHTQPGFIRTEADELTYPLHILVRYEIERLLMSGEAKASAVPGLWAEKYKNYLGLKVPNAKLGPLQDIHWSCGDFGYFPTYALGTAYAAQFMATMEKNGVLSWDAIAEGDLSSPVAWLADNIWHWGRAKDSDELIQNACGEAFKPDYYTDYLTKKFSKLYRLS